MLDYVINNADTIVSVATCAVTVASVITAATETPKPETTLGKIYKILEIIALVIGKAKK